MNLRAAWSDSQLNKEELNKQTIVFTRLFDCVYVDPQWILFFSIQIQQMPRFHLTNQCWSN